VLEKNFASLVLFEEMMKLKANLIFEQNLNERGKMQI
jgi:hypothetical protein